MQFQVTKEELLFDLAVLPSNTKLRFSLKFMNRGIDRFYRPVAVSEKQLIKKFAHYIYRKNK